MPDAHSSQQQIDAILTQLTT